MFGPPILWRGELGETQTLILYCIGKRQFTRNETILIGSLFMNQLLKLQIRSQFSNSCRTTTACCLIVCLSSGLMGCKKPTAEPTVEKPTLQLTLVCTDQQFAETIKPAVQSYEIETGNQVAVEVRPITGLDQYDVAIIPAPELGQVADSVATLPAQLRNSGDIVQWPRILRSYANDLCQWGDDLKALPVAGDGMVLVYRQDLFAEARADYRKTQKGDLSSPASYEDLANIAAYFSKQRGKPALPPLPADDAELMSQFYRLAACYDRQARTDLSEDEKGDSNKRDINSIHFDRTTWEPRLESPGFVEAARWFQSTAESRPSDSQANPIKALVDGTAVVALLKLNELSELPLDEKGAIESRFGIAAMPGTRTFYGPDGEKRDFVGKPNYVPYLGDNAWVGVVAQSSSHAEQAWELLSVIASRQPSIARLSDPKADAGPYRDEHIENDRIQIWLRYRFPLDQTKQLVDDMKKFQDMSILNPVMTLRTPNRAALIEATAPIIRSIATGKLEPEAGMKQLTEAWQRAEESIDPETLKNWRRRSAGFR